MGAKTIKKRKPLNISQIVAIVFASLILCGTALLMLPFASRDGQSAGFLKALFTATSSTCVTGLILADTWVQWSGFGQVVIISLIEIGGLGFMSVASSVLFLLRKKISMNERAVIAVSVGSDDMNDVVRLQKKTIICSLGAEFVGAIILSLRFLSKYGPAKALKLGFFHSVSAFCNAGFDIFGFETPGGSISLYGTDTVVVLTLCFLILFGGLGFVVWDEIIRPRSKRKKLSVYTKLVLITSAALVFFGMLLVCLTEWNNPATLGAMSVPDKLKAALFQSVTSRTAGFAGIDQGGLSEGGKAVTMFLMIIGGNSGSTAGGLKCVTFVVLLLFLWAKLRGKENIHVFNRSIPEKHVMNALIVFGVMVFLSFIGGTIICATSSVSFTDALYEAISAIATVGLTTGITPALSVVSKLLLVVFMYFGRVGILTLSLGFMQGKQKGDKFKYADTDLLIG